MRIPSCFADSSPAMGVCSRRVTGSVTIRDRIRDALLAPGADVILVSGGSSVGSEDYAPRLIAEVGELAIHGVAMRPSSPAGVGRIGRALVFLLPGNPVSCLCAYDFFAGRAIRLRGGRVDRLAAPHAAVRRCAQDRFRNRPCGLLPRSRRRWPRRTHRAQRSIHTLFDDARRWLRHRPRGKRGLRARHRGHRVSVRVSRLTMPMSSKPVEERLPSASSQTQFLNVITRDEATARFQRAPSARPARQGNGAASRRAESRACRRRAADVDVPGFDRSNVDGFADAGERYVRRDGGNAAHGDAQRRGPRAGCHAPQRRSPPAMRRRLQPAACCRAEPTPILMVEHSESSRPKPDPA